MPKIPNFSGGTNIGPRSVTGVGFDSGATMEGNAIANFGQKFSQVVGGIAEDVARTRDNINVTELSNELRRRTQEAQRNLSERQEGDAEDGSDVADKAKRQFEEIYNDVMSRTTSGEAKRALAGYANSVGASFEGSAIEIAKNRLNTFVKDKSLKVSSDYAAEVMTNPGSLKDSLSGYEAFLNNNGTALSADDKDKLLKRHKDVLRESVISSYSDGEGENLEKALAAVRGVAGSAEENMLFSEMDAVSRKNLESKLQGAIKRRDVGIARDLEESVNELKIAAVMGDPVSPEKFQSIISKASRLNLDQKDKAKLIDSMKADAFTARVISSNKDSDMATLSELINNPQGVIANSKLSPSAKMKAMSEIQRAAENRVRMLSQDSVAVFVNEDPGIKKLLDSSVKSENGFYDFAFSAYDGDDAGQAERAAAIQGFKKYREALKTKQLALGLPQSVISKSQAQQIATQLQSMSITQATTYIGNISEAFGEDAGALMASVSGVMKGNSGEKLSAMLATSKFSDSAKMAMLENYKNPILESKKDVAQVLNVTEKEVGDLDSDAISKFDTIRSYFNGSTSGQLQLKSLQDAVILEARKLRIKGVENPSEQAYRNIIDASFESIDTGNGQIFRPRGTLAGKPRAPVQDVEKVLSSALNPDALKNASLHVPSRFKEDIRSGKVSLNDLASSNPFTTRAASFAMGKKGSELTDEELSNLWASHVATNAKWVSDDTGMGYKLMIDVGAGPLGEVLTVDGNTARPFTIMDSDIQRYGSQDLGIDLPSKKVPFSQSAIKFISGALKNMEMGER